MIGVKLFAIIAILLIALYFVLKALRRWPAIVQLLILVAIIYGLSQLSIVDPCFNPHPPQCRYMEQVWHTLFGYLVDHDMHYPENLNEILGMKYLNNKQEYKDLINSEHFTYSPPKQPLSSVYDVKYANDILMSYNSSACDVSISVCGHGTFTRARTAKEHPPYHFSNSGTFGQPITRDWAKSRSGLEIAIEHPETNGDSDKINFYLRNEIVNSNIGIIQSGARCVLEINGQVYATDDYGGKGTNLMDSRGYGPIPINLDQFYMVPHLELYSGHPAKPVFCSLPKGKVNIRVYYKIQTPTGEEFIKSNELAFEK